MESKLAILQTNLQRVTSQNKALQQKLSMVALYPKIQQERIALNEAADLLTNLKERTHQFLSLVQKNHSNGVVDSIDRNFKLYASKLSIYKTTLHSMQKDVKSSALETSKSIEEHARKSRKDVEIRFKKDRKIVEEMLDQFKRSCRDIFETELQRTTMSDLPSSSFPELQQLEKDYDLALTNLQQQAGMLRCQVQYKLSQRQDKKENTLSLYIERSKKYLDKSFSTIIEKAQKFLAQNNHLPKQTVMAEYLIMVDRMYWLEKMVLAFKERMLKEIIKVEKRKGQGQYQLREYWNQLCKSNTCNADRARQTIKELGNQIQ